MQSEIKKVIMSTKTKSVFQAFKKDFIDGDKNDTCKVFTIQSTASTSKYYPRGETLKSLKILNSWIKENL